jgi:hypothetical protein
VSAAHQDDRFRVFLNEVNRRHRIDAFAQRSKAAVAVGVPPPTLARAERLAAELTELERMYRVKESE